MIAVTPTPPDTERIQFPHGPLGGPPTAIEGGQGG